MTIRSALDVSASLIISRCTTIPVEAKLLEGQVVHREIIREAETSKADLIVIGSHGRTGLKRLFLGSVAQSVLGEAHIPVLVVRQ